MKQLVLLISLFLFAGSVTGFAQTTKEQIKERKALAKQSKSELNEKASKAARKEVQPILSFNHLLTRLAFEVKAGNDNAGGWDVTTYTAGEAATYNAGLDGAKAAGDVTPDDYAEKVGTPAGGATLTAEEAVAYNAKLAGAVTTADEKGQNAEKGSDDQ